MDRPPQQQQLHYRNVQIFKDKKLGNGSYGAVYKAMWGLLPCAAKLLHPLLIELSEPGDDPRRQFQQECHFLSTMKHPHIVQYLGTIQDPNSELPVLLMELMDESLTRFLKRSQHPLSYHIEVNLCHDIVLALDYLHSNNLIHRDLSSNNVLLIAGSRAKVTDFGMSKLLRISINPRTATKCPGATVYMPPEALSDHSVYSAKIDCFSFGVLEIQIMTRQFPEPGPSTRAVEDPRSPVGRILMPIPDSERRKPHIDLIDPTHPVLQTALRCLSYSEGDRPSAQVLCQDIATLKEAPRYTQSVEQAEEGGRRAQGDDTVRQLREVREENQLISQRNNELLFRLEATTQELQQSSATLADSQREIQQLRQELRTCTKDDTLVTSQRENQQLRQELRTKDDTLVTREREIQQLQQANKQEHHTVEARETELRQVRLQLQANEQVTAEFQQNLIQKEKAIHDLQQTISQLRQGPKEASKRVEEQQHVPEAKPTQVEQPKQLQQAIAQSVAKSPPQQQRPLTQPKGMKYVPEAKPTQVQQPKSLLQTFAAMFKKTPPLQQSSSTPPEGTQGGAAASDGQATEQQKMTIQWRPSRDTPKRMYRGSAVTHDKMAYFNPCRSTDVYQFNAEEDQWTTLPKCPYYNSGLTVVQDKLTTVGGSHGPLGGPTNSLASLTGEGKDRKWVEHFKRMPTSRYDLAAVCRGRTLIAAGGRDGGGTLETVEVMDTETLNWSHVSPLPHPMTEASIAVRQEKVFLLGGLNQNDVTLSVFSCSMSNLLKSQPLDAQLEKTTNQLTVWYRAADAPHFSSTAVVVGDNLLAIGGLSTAGEETSAILSYNRTTDSWEDIGHMTIPRELPLVAVLPRNELIVAGGIGRLLTGITKVEIGKIVA